MNGPGPLEPWITQGSKTLLETPYFTIIQKHMQTPAGDDAEYYMHTGMDGVLCVCVDDNGHILIERQYRPPLGRVSVDYPSGGLEATDADIEAGMRRELLEETGFVPRSLHCLATLDQNPGLSTSRLHIFLARGSIQQKPRPDHTESIVVEFIAPAGIVELIAKGDMRCVFCVSATFLAFKELGFMQFQDI